MDSVFSGALSAAGVTGNSNMYMVDHESTTELVKEYDAAVKKADELCGVQDPEETPYASKYTARELLDQVCNKVDATKTIASLEKKGRLMNEMAWRLACLRYVCMH